MLVDLHMHSYYSDGSFSPCEVVELAKQNKLDPVVGRENELDQLESILSRRRKNNAVIVGEAGVGKTVLVEGLAQRIANGNVSPSLRDAKIAANSAPKTSVTFSRRSSCL